VAGGPCGEQALWHIKHSRAGARSHKNTSSTQRRCQGWLGRAIWRAKRVWARPASP